MSNEGHRAIALFSGGLDSALAARLVLDQGIEILGIHFTSVFNAGYRDGAMPEPVERLAAEVGIPVRVEETSTELIALVTSPKHGYGANLNPCIDCRMMCLRRATAHAEEVGAEFLVTGEVVGQRPMSQRRDAIALIDEETGLGGRVLRPLSARALPPTVPETEGWVDRSRLLGIRGRGRKRQLAMARELGIRSHSSPAGGCVLTEIALSARLRVLLGGGLLTAENVKLVRSGRLFRGPGGELIVVGRDEAQNARLESLVREGDEVLSAAESSPLTVVRPGGGAFARELAARITARYCRARTESRVEIYYGPSLEEQAGSAEVAPADEALLDRVRAAE